MNNNVKNTILLSILLLYVVSSLLPVFKSIPLVPSERFYIPLWFIALATFYPKVFFGSSFMSASAFILVHVFYLMIDNYSGLDSRVTETQMFIFQGVFFGTSTWSYLNSQKDNKGLKTLAVIVLVLIVITNITNLNTLISDPLAIRKLSGNGNQQEVASLLRNNVVAYPYVYLLVFVGPLFFYIYRLNKKVVWLFIFVVCAITVIAAQIVTAVGLFFLHTFSILFLLKKPSYIRLFTSYLSIALVVFLGKWILVLFLNFVIELSGDAYSQISTKMEQLLELLETGKRTVEEEANSIYEYEIRYEKSRAGFLESPLIGGNKSGGHHYWIDNLCEHGLLGTFPWVLVFISFIYSARRSFSKGERVILINVIIIFIINGIFKNITITDMPFFLFFIPSLILFFFGKNSSLKYLVK